MAAGSGVGTEPSTAALGVLDHVRHRASRYGAEVNTP